MTTSKWTTPADVKAHLGRLWERGRLLAEIAEPSGLFPLRISVKRPTSQELGSGFEAARAWAAGLQGVTHARLETMEVTHRQIGRNAVPVAVWFDTIDDAVAFIAKGRDLQRFGKLVKLTARRCPSVMPLLAKRPHEALAELEVWPLLLDVVEWMQGHPRPGIYVRQVDVAGVHTKLVEQHQRTLAAMLDLALPESAIDSSFGQSDFVRRYGFRSRPRMVRFRSLDSRRPLTPADLDRDYSLTAADFGRVTPPRRLFITENEVNFLAFPDVTDAMVVFGAGSGFEHLVQVPWLADVPVHYWGDIDTHGFAILDQLRAVVPQSTSMLMDRATLLSHERYWGLESKPTQRDLHRLTTDERAVYDDLRDNRLRPNLRLEQERIRFGDVQAAIERLHG